MTDKQRSKAIYAKRFPLIQIKVLLMVQLQQRLSHLHSTASRIAATSAWMPETDVGIT
jgi:hypothetical protein